MSRTGLKPNGVTTKSDKGLQNKPQRSGAFSGADKPSSGDFGVNLQQVIDACRTGQFDTNILPP